MYSVYITMILIQQHAASITIYELSTDTDLEILRNRAQNQQIWRKGVDAKIEEYKRK